MCRFSVLKRWVFAFLMITACAGAHAQSADYRFLHSKSPLQDRIGYLLTLLETDASVRRDLLNSPALQAVGHRLRETREKVLSLCINTMGCRVDSMMLSPSEIDVIGSTLSSLTTPSSSLSGLIRNQMRLSGRFQRHADLDDAALLRAAWLDIANAVNRLYRVYGTEQSYKMPDDGPSYGTEAASGLPEALSAEIDSAQDESFFGPWSRLAFDLLIVNQRDEAARYEPLETGANEAAFLNAKGLNWKAWRYSAILVPGVGLGPDERGLSPDGEFRVRMAAKRWHEGLAPLVIVSGGHVHPNRTPYDEAVEMKHALMTQYQLPESAIVMDPYARHTTTNLRNASRLLFYLRAPLDREFVITADAATISEISSKGFAERCSQELGYLPAPISEQSSRFDLAVRPNIASLYVDPLDPLDP